MMDIDYMDGNLAKCGHSDCHPYRVVDADDDGNVDFKLVDSCEDAWKEWNDRTYVGPPPADILTFFQEDFQEIPSILTRDADGIMRFIEDNEGDLSREEVVDNRELTLMSELIEEINHHLSESLRTANFLHPDALSEYRSSPWVSYLVREIEANIACAIVTMMKSISEGNRKITGED